MTAALAKPQKQREIVDRLAVLERLAALAEDGEPDRRRVAEVLKEALQAGRAEVRQRFEAGALGGDTVRSLSFLVDQLIRALHDFVTTAVYPLANPTAGEHLGVVAVGGYGRGELA
ncbi:MAG TPA: bifunctional uridylyltransferase/uridylyl-removing protein, partial [Stellaceae bacterium]|nr:bifunctional uridylyltransferase/uridylyl-removing protein [Stellaceae bacterium]